MENMPKLVLLKITSYLQPKDLVACSAVCKCWREKFNIDPIWRSHIKFTEKFYRIQEKFKDMILCPPSFTSLEPLCAAREYYIRDQCLRFNCRAGMFTVDEIILINPNKIRQFANTVDEEGNYWLFVNTLETIEVWNITNKPFFQCYVSKVLPNGVDSMYILETKLVLVLSELVLVYSFDHPKYELVLQCGFYFHDENPTEDLQKLFEDKQQKPLEIGNGNMKHLLNGNVLIGFTGQIPKSVLPAACMHIWNMDTLVKLYRTNISSPSLSPVFFGQDEVFDKLIHIDILEGDSQYVIVVVSEQEMENMTLLHFNFQSRCFYLIKNFNSTKVLYSCIVDSCALVFGFSMRNGFFFSLIDRNRGEISQKIVSKLGMDAKGQVIFSYPMYMQTYEKTTLFSVATKDNKIVIKRILEDTSLRGNHLKICGKFMLSKSNESPITMWDLDCKYPIKDFPEFSKNVDMNLIQCLKKADFPPKVICASNERSSLYVLSFW